MKIRLYGPTIGQGSFVRVAAGMREGLSAEGVLAGFVPIDALDDEAAYPGHDAEIGLYVGPPPGATVMVQRGWHKQRLCLFSPNSTWIASNIIEALTKKSAKSDAYCTGFVTPSRWAASLLAQHVSVPVILCHHGVGTDFVSSEAASVRRRKMYAEGSFECVHFASTPMERKSTRELMRAWVALAEQGKLGRYPQLNLLVDGNLQDFIGVVAGRPASVLETMQWRGRMSLPAHAAAALYRRSHACVQPSRGEAFGLCPLEARCCGTIAVATDCTGHRDQLDPTAVGFVPVETGDLEPIDDGPGALAPSLAVEAVERALVDAYTNWSAYTAALEKQAEELAHHWSWTSVTERFVDELRRAKWT